ncbi:MAG: hypothetical protein AB7F76_08945 [Parvibaculaceae bacterium]
MTISFYSTLGFLIFLAIGIIDLAIYRRFIHPRLIRAHERAKVTGTQGQGPARIAKVMFIANLIILPIFGFLIGDVMFNG